MTQTTTRTDTELKNAVIAELTWTPSIDGTHIGVSVNHGAVSLSGEVESFPERRLAQEAATRVHGVTAIAADISVRSNWGAANDVDLARDAGHAIDRATNVPDDSVKVVVHEHRITLSGEVSWHYQREAAVSAVEFLKGVDEVVNQIGIRPNVSTTDIRHSIVEAYVRSAQVEGDHLDVRATPAGAVTLAGTVGTWDERHQAEHLAWSAAGVTSVDNQLVIRV